jgi:Domain of unknown function (DUF1338)
MVLLDLLWERYARDVPYARVFVQLAHGMKLDHVAFRSLAREGGGIDLVAGVFEKRGWVRQDSYDFPDAHLDAIHLSHPGGLPRIFVSQLRVNELSAQAQAILARVPADPPPPDDPVALADWFRPAETPVDEAELLALERESQYAAWMLAFGRSVNHFTAAVDDVAVWQQRMKEAGIPMKSVIEGEPGSKLRQTATLAYAMPITLAGGETRDWPYAYLEIAERNGGFDGFLGAQARQLFDMTRRQG